MQSSSARTHISCLYVLVHIFPEICSYLFHFTESFLKCHQRSSIHQVQSLPSFHPLDLFMAFDNVEHLLLYSWTSLGFHEIILFCSPALRNDSSLASLLTLLPPSMTKSWCPPKLLSRSALLHLYLFYLLIFNEHPYINTPISNPNAAHSRNSILIQPSVKHICLDTQLVTN